MEESLGKIIQRLREQKGFSKAKLGRLSGIDSSYISKLEADSAGTITLKTAQRLATALEVPPEIFLRTETIAPPKDIAAMLRELSGALEASVLARIPLLGVVPGGEPFTPIETPLEYVLVPQSLIKGIIHPYAVKLSGDSLEGFDLHDGDTLIISPDGEVMEDKIYIVRIGSEVTVKKIHKEDDRLRLIGSNCTFEIMEPRRVENLGKVVAHGQWTAI